VRCILEIKTKVGIVCSGIYYFVYYESIKRKLKTGMGAGWFMEQGSLFFFFSFIGFIKNNRELAVIKKQEDVSNE
jgi:hypothetical protein